MQKFFCSYLGRNGGTVGVWEGTRPPDFCKSKRKFLLKELFEIDILKFNFSIFSDGKVENTNNNEVSNTNKRDFDIMPVQFEQKFSDWKQTNRTRPDQEAIEKCLFVKRAGLILPLAQRVQLCRDVEDYIREKKPFKCDICETSYKLEIELNSHVSLVHEEEKPFICDISPAAVDTEGNYKLPHFPLNFTNY